MTLPLAHLGHYLWILYLLPVLLVIVGILRTSILQRRREPDPHSEISGSAEPGPIGEPPSDSSGGPDPPGG